ncbi:hypothetical protein P691DRAFT_804022 [Macrolepiota fuliginosa MF-IS2]|uniref:FIST domain-containing protein n=1 Tax=Macrolepiota fuliginosa MF-IS2 TaxID=1400762 RepID=A0A9P5X7N4_9AGAR|nr:hypothetical protein P691DRAFT_804022 [Macrolepiota fuliginosa MF-IS2]
MVLHLSTHLSRSPAGLLSRIQALSNLYAGNDLTLLFALSASIPDSQDLGRAVNGLMNLENTRTIGCLSGRLGSTQINGKDIGNDTLSLSVAVFDSRTVKSFRSTIPGREETQVGRWHAFRRKEEKEGTEYPLNEGVSWEDVWKGNKETLLPEELRTLDLSEIQSILYFSDLKPEGLLSSFQNLPDVSKLGLLASSTPFITGRPVTLFQNKEIFGSGAVGLAITGETKSIPRLRADFLSVQKLGGVMTVTQSEGNMVNTLDNDNPTQILLSAIKRSGLDTHVSGSFKEEEQFSLGAVSSDGNIDRVYRITAGDPSRGSISVDSPSAPIPGTRVQFLHRPMSAVPNLSLSRTSQSLNFLTVSDELHQSRQSTPEDLDILLQNAFLASSENGFIFERATQSGENVKCSLAGSLGTLSWPSPQLVSGLQENS